MNLRQNINTLLRVQSVYDQGSLRLISYNTPSSIVPIGNLIGIKDSPDLGFCILSDPAIKEYEVPEIIAGNAKALKSYTERKHIERLLNDSPGLKSWENLRTNESDPPDFFVTHNGKDYGIEHRELTCSARRIVESAIAGLIDILLAKPTPTYNHLAGFCISVVIDESLHFQTSPRIAGLKKENFVILSAMLEEFRFNNDLYQKFASTKSAASFMNNSQYVDAQSVTSNGITLFVQPLLQADDSALYKAHGFTITATIQYHIRSNEVAVWLSEVVQEKEQKLVNANAQQKNALAIFLGAPDRKGIRWPAEECLSALVEHIPLETLRFETKYIDRLFIYLWNERKVLDLSVCLVHTDCESTDMQ